MSKIRERYLDNYFNLGILKLIVTYKQRIVGWDQSIIINQWCSWKISILRIISNLVDLGANRK